MIIFSITITLFYLFLIGSFIYGFDKIKIFMKEDLPSKTKFSIVIPFRNEAENLPSLLKTIQYLNYPKELFEVIFIDDGSKDQSWSIIEQLKKENSCIKGIKFRRN